MKAIVKVEASHTNPRDEWSVRIGVGQVVDLDAQLPNAPEGVTLRTAFSPVENFFDIEHDSE